MKRRFLAFLLFIMALSLFAGCATNSQEKNTRHLNVALYWFGDSVDPAHDWDGWTVMRVGAGETLVTVTDKMEFAPQLADSWENVDPTTWRFHIREGVKFQNGEAMTPELVKASLERTLKESPRSQKSSKIASISVEGQNLIVKTSEPYGALPATLTEPAFIIMDTNADLSNAASAPILTGPYQIVGFQKGQEIDLKRNENYWDGTPGLESLTVKNIEDDDKRAMALQAGDVNLIQRVNQASRSLFPEDKYTLAESVGVRVFMFRLNFDRVLKDTNLRHALAYATHYEDLTKVEGNGALVGGALFPPKIGPTPTDSHKEHEDLAKAKEYLAAAGYTGTNADGYVTKDGQPLTLTAFVWGSKKDVYEALQQEFKAAGIKLELRQVQNSEEAKTRRDFDLEESNWITMGTNDPYWYLDQTLRSTSPENVGHYQNAQVDALLDSMAGVTKPEERMQIAGQIQDLALQDIPALYLFCPANQAVMQKRVTGVVVHPIDYYFITKDIHLADQ